MKTYLNFTLKGSQLLPVWIAFFFLFMIPYFFLIEELNTLTATEVSADATSKLFFLYLAIVLAAAFAFVFFMTLLVVQNIEYKGENAHTDYNPLRYVGLIVSGLLLTIVTIGIYLPWFIKNIHSYFVHGVSFASHRFTFKGQGSKLFVIMTLTIFIPFLLVGIMLFSILESAIDLQSQNFLLIYQLIVMFSLVPNIYLILKWMVDIRYKDYLIRWDTEFFPATGKIALELILAVITFGVYFPLAYIRLYHYFVEHTKSNVINGHQLAMGYEGNHVADFLFMWGQIILTVLTLGFYYPWAFTRIARRVFSKTYLQNSIGPLPEKTTYL